MGPYGETRWGLQAMETVQKIVDSGVALSQRVSLYFLLHAAILLFFHSPSFILFKSKFCLPFRLFCYSRQYFIVCPIPIIH